MRNDSGREEDKSDAAPRQTGSTYSLTSCIPEGDAVTEVHWKGSFVSN